MTCGPREDFIEALRPNVSLLRRKIHHPDLRVENFRFGRYSQTDISIVQTDILAKLRERLGKIDVDAILDSGHIARHGFSLFANCVDLACCYHDSDRAQLNLSSPADPDQQNDCQKWAGEPEKCH